MKIQIKLLLLLPALMAGLCFIPSDRLQAQAFTTVHRFAGGTNGALPHAGLILSESTLFGTTREGGISNQGTIFAIKTNGIGFTNLHNFNKVDGSHPYAGLILEGNTLYGATPEGGVTNGGAVFSIETNGAAFTNLHPFNSDTGEGKSPYAGVILLDDILYGVTKGGGSSAKGTVFALRGDSLTTLHHFSSAGGALADNRDGFSPEGKLTASGNTLYGTAPSGGTLGKGTVFAVRTNGTGFTTLHHFTATSGSPPFGNNDGATPYAGLILGGDTLYGTALFGGESGNGSIFSLHTDGTGFRTLHSFTALSNSTNTDGANPSGGLVLLGNTLYGTATFGGSADNGTVFALNTNGSGFTTLHHFSADSGGVTGTNRDGANPYAGLIITDNKLYGTTRLGGAGFGTVFSISVPPQPPSLAMNLSGTEIVFTWPTNPPGYTLQSATNRASTVWDTNFPAPVIVNGQNTVTTPIPAIRKIYRLRQ